MTKKFILRGTTDIKGIYLRIRDGVEVDIRIKTGLKISIKKWDKKTGMPKEVYDDKENEAITYQLRAILESVKLYQFGPGLGIPINSIWLEKAINYNNLKNQDNKGLIERIQSYIEFLPYKHKNGRKGVSEGTVRNYNTTIGRIQKYDEFTKSKSVLTDLNFDFHDKYIKFATEVLGLSINSIGRDIKNIKAVCNDAKDRGIAVNENVFSKRFNAPRENSKFVILTLEELNKIEKFSGAPYLENVRDWLIVGFWTGARVNDLMSLNSENLVIEKERTVIKYEQRKTQKVVKLGLHPQVESIIDNRGGEFPNPISDVKFNEWIKIVCQNVGIDELIEGALFDKELKRKVHGIYPKFRFVQSHICRRSFASWHYGKVPTSKIMAATGHSTERMLLTYIGETEEDHIQDFIEVWSK